MKYYIAGKITGDKDYKKKFEYVQVLLEREGHLVMNPSVLGEGFPWEAYMPICYAMIDACDEIALLPNWEDSKGAKLEKAYGEQRGKPINYVSVELGTQ